MREAITAEKGKRNGEGDEGRVGDTLGNQSG